MAGDRDQSDGPVVQPSELAARHNRGGRTTAKHRRPTNSGVKPPLPRGQARRTTRRVGDQQELPFRDPYAGGGMGRRRTLARIIPDGFGPRAIKVGLALFFLVLLFGGLIWGMYYFGGSRFFEFRHLVLQNQKRVTREEVMEIVKRTAPDGVWRVQIKRVRDRLKEHDLIEDAEVTRVLSDTIYVTLTEREPYTLARTSDGRLVCVDRNGAMFGTSALLRGQNIPPIVSGLVESGDDIKEANRQRMMAYQQVIKELDNAQPQLSTRIDEVIFDAELSVRLMLKDSQVVVLVGSEDFRTRLNAALDVLDAVRKKDAESLQVLKIEDAQKLLGGSRIAYINATIPKRVIVGLAE
ncbi:MAG TPA: FtsQ-type POTRA domain-containing protein [Blastocatellia bacterium]|nr:FtsQ-type POTRA domain-containing protein [Blastocatellia bacterium]